MTPENQSDEEYWAIEIANKCSIIPEDKLQLANELFSAITSLRKSWEREKVAIAENDNGQLTNYILRKWDREKLERFALHLLGDQYQAEKSALEKWVSELQAKLLLEAGRWSDENLKNKALEERVRELMRSFTAEEQKQFEDHKQKTGEIMVLVSEKEITRLKSRNEELEKPPTDEEFRSLLFHNKHYVDLKAERDSLKAENEKLLKLVRDRDDWYGEKEKSDNEISRLISALVAAHEKLRESSGLIKMLDRDRKYPSLDEHLDKVKEILSDPSGSLAFEKWKKMEAVVERAKLWWRLHRPIGWSVKKHHQTPKVNCGSDIEGNLALAVSNIEALDAKGDGK